MLHRGTQQCHRPWAPRDAVDAGHGGTTALEGHLCQHRVSRVDQVGPDDAALWRLAVWRLRRCLRRCTAYAKTGVVRSHVVTAATITQRVAMLPADRSIRSGTGNDRP